MDDFPFPFTSGHHALLLSTSPWELFVSYFKPGTIRLIHFSMCLSAPALISPASLTTLLVNLNPIAPDFDISRPSPSFSDVSAYPHASSSALAPDFAVGEVVWLGVPGPS